MFKNYSLVTVLSLAMLSSAAAETQQALQICNALNNSLVVDKTSAATSTKLARDELEIFCSDTQNQMSRATAKGGDFFASLDFAKTKLGLDGSSSASSSLTEEQIQRVCEVGRAEFASSYAATFSTDNGSALGRIVADCVARVLTGDRNFIYGTVSLDSSGKYILADLHRETNSGQAELSFSGVTRSERFNACQVGSEPAAAAKLKKDLSLSCAVSLTLDEEQDGGAKTVEGSIVFKAADADGLNIPFAAVRRDIVEEFQRDAVAPLQTELTALQKDVEALSTELQSLSAAQSVDPATDAKVRMPPELYTIYYDVPAAQQLGVEQGDGFLRRRIMPIGQGICALNQVGMDFTGPAGVKMQATIDNRDGFWTLMAYTGAKSPPGGFAGATCWRWK